MTIQRKHTSDTRAHAAQTPRSQVDSIGESVTPDAQMSVPHDWTFQACGIDTLDLGFFVNWRNWKWLENELSQGKAKAIKAKSDGALIEIGIPELVSNPNGKPPNYQFGLVTPEYRIWIAARQNPNNFPNVYVSPLASTLWLKGMDATIERISADIREIGGEIEGVRPSRVDFAADFWIPGGLNENWIENHRVSRANRVNIYRDGPKMQTFNVGRGSGPVQLRIYDKTAELRHSGKQWLRQIWPSNPSADVWRIEFQLRRKALREFKIESPRKLQAYAASMWRYLTGTWFSLREHDSEHTSRRTVCPLWQEVQRVADRLPGAFDADRSKDPAEVDIKRILQQVLGYTKTYGACRSETDIAVAFEKLGRDAAALTTPEEFAEAVRKRAIQAGLRINNSTGGAA